MPQPRRKARSQPGIDARNAGFLNNIFARLNGRLAGDGRPTRAPRWTKKARARSGLILPITGNMENIQRDKPLETLPFYPAVENQVKIGLEISALESSGKNLGQYWR